MAYPEKALIVVSSPALFQRHPYQLRLISEEWARRGTRVEVTDQIDRPADAEVVVSHVSTTVLPEAYRRFFNQHPCVINGRVVDISKRRISRSRVLRPDDYDGPVVLKTNRNAGGWPDLRLRLKNRWVIGITQRLLQRLPFVLTGLSGPERYPIYNHPSQVPWLAWRNPNLLVEKFQPEKVDGLYCLRQYVFFGDREANSISYGTHPIVKASSIVRREPLGPAPEALRALRQELGFDFGKFDYVISDGEVVLYDANPTPTFGDMTSEPARQLAAELAKGIKTFLKQPPSVPAPSAQKEAV